MNRPVDIERLRELCLIFPGVTEDIKWSHHLCFSVAGKLFLVLGLDESPVSASFKVPGEVFDKMISRKGFRPAPYMGRNKWVQVDDITRLPEAEWHHFARQSYELKRQKLPKKVQQKLAR